jgi:hypothetical protein
VFIEDASDHVESLRSPGIKKCCSNCGLDEAELIVEPPGMEGTGGTKRLGDSGGERTVTPGIYAICITFEARVRTVEAIEWADLVD